MERILEAKDTEVGTKLFPEATWSALAGDLARAFRMTEVEEESFRSHKIAKLIAAIPYLAGCDDAARTAVAHLGTYLLSVRETKPYFNATARDGSGILERLWLGSQFRGGDAKIIERGMCLLALNMISDYKRDLEEDAALGKYNPLAAGDFDFKATVEKLEWTIVTSHCPEMDEIASIGEMPLSYWVE